MDPIMPRKGEAEVSGGNAAPAEAKTDGNHFPTRLHMMLSALEDGNGSSDGADSIGWQPHGKVFMIRNADVFVDKVLTKWFCRLKYTSFQRQLCLYGFRKLTKKGPDQGAYYHPKFIRGELDLAASIAPSKIKGRRGRRPKSEDNEPDFYWADETITKEDADEKKKVADTNDGPNSRPGVLSSTREMMLSTSAFIRSDPRRPAEAKAADSLTDSPDQSALEVLLHSLPRDDAAGGNRQGYESIWPTMPEHQAIRQQDTGVTTSQVDTTRATGVATRRFSDFSEVSNTWLWNSLSTDEMPAAASMPRAHHPEQQQQQQQLGDPDVAFKTIGALSPRLDDINLHLQGAQTQQLQEHHLQRVLQEQRLKDLMELNRKQQHNLRIQQEKLEQQRRDLQLREQEQLQRLGMELELQREQNRVQERSQVQQFRQAAPLPQRPEFFHPPIQQEPFTGSHIDQVPIQQDQRESRKSEPRGTGGSQQQNDEKSPGKSARGFS